MLSFVSIKYKLMTELLASPSPECARRVYVESSAVDQVITSVEQSEFSSHGQLDPKIHMLGSHVLPETSEYFLYGLFLSCVVS